MRKVLLPVLAAAAVAVSSLAFVTSALAAGGCATAPTTAATPVEMETVTPVTIESQDEG